jgi:hypothetical protein
MLLPNFRLIAIQFSALSDTFIRGVNHPFTFIVLLFIFVYNFFFLLSLHIFPSIFCPFCSCIHLLSFFIFSFFFLYSFLTVLTFFLACYVTAQDVQYADLPTKGADHTLKRFIIITTFMD